MVADDAAHFRTWHLPCLSETTVLLSSVPDVLGVGKDWQAS